MPVWDPFLAVTLLTLGLLLVLARLSQNTIDEYAPSEPEPQENAQTPVPDDPADMRPREPGDGVLNASVHAPANPSSETAGLHRQATDGEPEITLTSTVLMANVALTQGFVLLVLGLSAWYFEIPATAFGITAEASNSGIPAVALGLGFGLALWVANELSTRVADAAGAAYDERVRELLAPESPGGWIALFAGALPLIAVAEELVFRAALIGVPTAAYGVNVWALAVASSLAFALGHGAQGRVGVVVTGALGLVLAAGYVLTGSLLVVVVAHYVINALEFLVHELLEWG